MEDLKKYLSTRRQKILLGLKSNQALLILSPPIYLKTADQHHSFRQSSDLIYLSNWTKENSALLAFEGKFFLFIEQPTPLRLLWDGHVPDLDEAKEITGIEQVYYRQDLPEYLRKIKNKNLYYDFGKHALNDKLVLDYSFSSLISPQLLVGVSRLVKDEYEIAQLKRSCEISALAHREVWQKLKPGMNESEFAMELEFAFRKKGSDRSAYGPIVASGKNATCLHYSANNCIMQKNDLLLVDAAGEYHHYASDITRTFPVNGWQNGGTDEQKMIYDIVLDAQLQGIRQSKIGMTPMGLHQMTTDYLKEGLLKSGVIKDPEHIKKLYPHGTGHWLGLDVHDECPREIMGEEIKFTPGMVFTVEPGLYFYGEMAEIYPRFAGIGIRIEDDILVTEDDPLVMTSAIEK